MTTAEETKMATNATETKTISTWDLTPSISTHLDLHMIFSLLEYVDYPISQSLIP